MTGNEAYFRACDLQEKQWRCRVNMNAKTREVNRKLHEWHARNPDRKIVNLAAMRFERVRRRAKAAL